MYWDGSFSNSYYFKRGLYERRKEMKIVSIVLLSIISLLLFGYGSSVMMLNSGSSFYLIWFAGGLFLLLIAFLIYKDLLKKIPKIIKIIFWICFTIGFVILVYTQVLIISCFNKTPINNLDFIIVLGAQVRKEGPGTVLQYRLDAAIDYLNNNPDTLVIVTGGKGVNEPSPEAVIMQDYLIKKGIDKERIRIEYECQNTTQNISNSLKLYDIKDKKVGIVTNNFHLYRAMSIAKKQGIKNVYGISAYSTPYYLPHNSIRETAGILKDTLFGNM